MPPFLTQGKTMSFEQIFNEMSDLKIRVTMLEHNNIEADKKFILLNQTIQETAMGIASINQTLSSIKHLTYGAASMLALILIFAVFGFKDALLFAIKHL